MRSSALLGMLGIALHSRIQKHTHATDMHAHAHAHTDCSGILSLLRFLRVPCISFIAERLRKKFVNWNQVHVREFLQISEES